MFEGRKKYRVAIIANIVIGDISVAMAGTHVGKGRYTAAVRAHENLFHERGVNYYFNKEALAVDIKKNDSRSKDQGYESSLMAKFVNKSHHHAGSPASYQNEDNIEEGSGINFDGHHIREASSVQKVKLLKKLAGKARILDS